MNLRTIIIYLFVALITNSCKAQQPLIIQAKIWSKDSLKVVHYSDWNLFNATTINQLKNYTPTTAQSVDEYGGLKDLKSTATGFFRTEKINNRWWIIDPKGNYFITTAVNSLRQGKSQNSVTAFQTKYKAEQEWIDATKKSFDDLGFNVVGSWSEVAAITNYNKTHNQHFVYCTQLSVLAGYRKQAIQKNKERKKESEIAFILDDEFETYCNTELQKISEYQNDDNLLGHFSDNEIPFTHNEFNDLLKDRNAFLLNWLKEKSIDEQNISTENKKEFIGLLAQKYYSVVGKAIKKYDPNHLYIGSRLHSNAKNNPYIFKALEPFVDVVSINYYGFWQPQEKDITDWSNWTTKPFFITEFYTKAEETGMPNLSGAGWIVKTQKDRGIHYQNFCLQLLRAKNCVGWHWFRYQDNDPNDKSADASNNDSNKGIVNVQYDYYSVLTDMMKELNINKYKLVKYFDELK